MRFISTRNNGETVSFKDALLRCMPTDGGLYVPHDTEDLRHWILYADDKTSFANLSGTLTSALINKEFSPIICETIATSAFPYEPKVKQLAPNLFVLELFHGPTGTFKDFGTSYLTASLETILRYYDEKSILIGASTGELGACLAAALRGKKLLKSVIIYPKGCVCGLEEQDLAWNGGNIYPIEVDGTEAECRDMVRQIFSNKEMINKYHLTLANTANIGRIIPQTFFYTYAFTKIKKLVDGGIYFAMSVGNYGNLISGLYSWQQALPVNGFIMPTNNNLKLDAQGNVEVLDSFVPIEKRKPADPADPSNLERMEHLFKANSLMLRSFVYPADISKDETDKACKELFIKYKYFADSETSAAYAAAKARNDISDDDAAVVIIARNSPLKDLPFIRKNIGEVPEMTANVEHSQKTIEINKPIITPSNMDYVTTVLNSLNLQRIF